MSKGTKAKTFIFFSIIALLSFCSGSTGTYSNTTSQTPPAQLQKKEEDKGTVTQVAPNPLPKPTCIQGEEVLRNCKSCNLATMTYKNSDCSTITIDTPDSSCSYLCPVPAPQPVYNPQPTTDYCCKHCTTGKACGDSCISRNKNCNKGPGCACDY